MSLFFKEFMKRKHATQPICKTQLKCLQDFLFYGVITSNVYELLKAILSMKVNLSYLYFGNNTSIRSIASLQTPLEIARKGSSNEVVEILEFFLTINKST